MIIIQPFIDQLDKLKEYIDLKIDNNTGGIWIDIETLENVFIETNYRYLSPDKIIGLFFQTGVLLCRSDNFKEPKVRMMTFEEFCQTGK